jgi:hypothetical protein
MRLSLRETQLLIADAATAATVRQHAVRATRCPLAAYRHPIPSAVHGFAIVLPTFYAVDLPVLDSKLIALCGFGLHYARNYPGACRRSVQAALQWARAPPAQHTRFPVSLSCLRAMPTTADAEPSR